jgi:AraC-like DNA-binding protein
MRDQRDEINYQPDDQTRRRSRVKLSGVTLELVRVPPEAHAFYRDSPRHLLMFTGPGARRDGESRVYGQAVSTLRNTSGTFTLIPAECTYEGWAVPTVAAEYLSVAIDPSTPILDPAHDLDGICRTAALYRKDIPDELQLTLEKTRRAMSIPGGLDALRAETLLSLLMLEMRDWLAADPRFEVPRGGLAAWQQRRATAMLEARLDGQVGIAELASACGLSPSHFAHAFRRSIGMPPHRWLLHRRIDLARDLLMRTAMPLADIALDCGFAGQSHFGRVFADLIGTSPGAWRREHRMGNVRAKVRQAGGAATDCD